MCHVQKPPALQTMRLTEERWALSGERISRQAFPYMAIRYAELQRSLSEVLPPDSIAYGRKVLRIEPLGAGALRLAIKAADAVCHVDCDLVVAADGPRSLLRRHVAPSAPPDLRFAGYAAWRGNLPSCSVHPVFVGWLLGFF
jgi:2-polyprenyl-6-methoxyphenol hydroxylase-like FAD-dependent oxidoreductase